MKQFDIIGNELHVGDFVVTTESTSDKGMYLYEITKITPKSVGVNGLGEGFRLSITHPHLYCVKVSVEYAETYKNHHKEYRALCSENHKERKQSPLYRYWFEEKLQNK